MNLILEGIVLGLTLAIMLGPIFVTITQLAIEKGARAGLTATLGVWISDFIIISSCYYFLQQVSNIFKDPTFVFWMGLFGGFIFIVFGIVAFLNKGVKLEYKKEKHSKNDYLSYFSKGFFVNTVNPFTFVFWIGVISTKVINVNLSERDIIIFLSSIMVMIILSDILKVFLAKLIRKRLKSHHFQIFSKIAGVGLILLGIGVLVRIQGGF